MASKTEWRSEWRAEFEKAERDAQTIPRNPRRKGRNRDA
jgi:hypothetical protein